jgi:hypothetical protein
MATKAQRHKESPFVKTYLCALVSVAKMFYLKLQK